MPHDDLRILKDFRRGQPVRIEVDGEPLQAFEGETVATALLASGRRIFRHTPGGSPRGLYCGMGICFDCVVEVDGESSVRSCITLVRPGMKVRTPRPFGREEAQP
jgi:predicted molibdopterin-dependent oxidoreductase YjgC